MSEIPELTDEQKDCLAVMARLDSPMESRAGVSLATAESLRDLGLVKLFVKRSRRKWTAYFTDEGRRVGQTVKHFVPPSRMSAAEATRLVGLELHKDHPNHYMRQVSESLDYSSLERFTRDLRAWCGDRTELTGEVLDAADYADLYTDFGNFLEKFPEGEAEMADNLIPVRITPAVMNVFSETGTWEDPKDEPDVYKELHALPWVAKRATVGAVTLETLGWMLDTSENLLALGDYLTTPQAKSVRKFVDDYKGTYKVAGGHEMTMGEKKAQEKREAAEREKEYGKPVPHVKTGQIVGYLKAGKFTPIEDVK
ncbi:hypothetical protein ACFRCI_17335 [Streptomyces sp. NPDC056638]|uniref:hypothetical protein n=1 Tax=Streptomyces sp. NPDC056638 TaxID=3345887 RepID=UPI00367C733B